MKNFNTKVTTETCMYGECSARLSEANYTNKIFVH